MYDLPLHLDKNVLMATISTHSDLHAISSEHPCLPGHFPGNPIVPGVVTLNLLFEQLQRDFPGWEPVGIRKLKFLQPLLPQQRFTFEWAQIKDNGLRFKCLLAVDASVLAEGHIKLHRHRNSPG